MNIEEMQEALELIKKTGIHVAGDFVMKKEVQYEVDNVEDGGIGIQINQYSEKLGTPDIPKEGDPNVEKPLNVALNSTQRSILKNAEGIGIISYNNDRKGYDKGDMASQALVAYLCGRLFCGDYADEDGLWIQGKRFEEAKYCESLFGFDVSNTRRSSIGNGIGKAPVGYKKVDSLFQK